jgi:hypothetical protein
LSFRRIECGTVETPERLSRQVIQSSSFVHRSVEALLLELQGTQGQTIADHTGNRQPSRAVEVCATFYHLARGAAWQRDNNAASFHGNVQGRAGLGLVRQPEAYQRHTGESDADLLQRRASCDRLGRTPGEFIEFVVHNFRFLRCNFLR